MTNFTGPLYVFAGATADVDICVNDADSNLANGCSTTWKPGSTTTLASLGQVSAGDTVGIRMTSDASYLTEKIATVQIGTRVTDWSVTTAVACDTTPQVFTTVGDTAYQVPTSCDTITIEAFGAADGGAGGGGGSGVERDSDTTVIIAAGGGGGGGNDDISGTPSPCGSYCGAGGGGGTPKPTF